MHPEMMSLATAVTAKLFGSAGLVLASSL